MQGDSNGGGNGVPSAVVDGACKVENKNSVQSPISEEERKLVSEKLKNKFSEQEFIELQDVEVKAMGIFFNKHPNVDMEHRIAETSYAFYSLDK